MVIDLPPDPDNEKRLAAEAAAGLVEDGMMVGLGTGSTVAHLLPALAARKLAIRCVATSVETERQAASSASSRGRSTGIERLDIAIDGADQIAPDGWLVKGGGGAHTREKIVAAAADRFVVIGDSSKPVDEIGAPIPLELHRFGLAATLHELGDAAFARTPAPSPDDGLIADYRGEVGDPILLAARLSATPGVVDHGLFPPGLVADVLVARGDEVEHTRALDHLVDRLGAGQEGGLARPHPARRDRRVAGPQLRQRLGLVGAGDQPEHRAGGLDRRICERHPATALVLAGQRNRAGP